MSTFLRRESQAQHTAPHEMAVIFIVCAVLRTTAFAANGAYRTNIVLGHCFSTDGPCTTSGPHAKSLLVDTAIRKSLAFNGLLAKVKICPYLGYCCICIDVLVYCPWTTSTLLLHGWCIAKISCVVKGKVERGMKKVENQCSRRMLPSPGCTCMSMHA